MSDLRFYLSWTALLLSLAGIFAWAWWAANHRRLWLFTVPPLLWLVHLSIFYTVLLAMNSSPTEFFATWSAIIRIQGITTVTVAAIIFRNGKLFK
jgi:hypothetical protein